METRIEKGKPKSVNADSPSLLIFVPLSSFTTFSTDDDDIAFSFLFLSVAVERQDGKEECLLSLVRPCSILLFFFGWNNNDDGDGGGDISYI